MSETFYSVRHYTLGKDKPVDEWFDDKEEAKRFSKRNLSDRVICHCFQNERSIQAARHFVKVSHMDEMGEETGPLA